MLRWVPRHFNIDAHLIDTVARNNHNAFLDAKVPRSQVRAYQQDQKKETGSKLRHSQEKQERQKIESWVA